MNELNAQKILAYIGENLFAPRAGWGDLYFNQRSYARWAAYELLDFVMDRPSVPADRTVYEFAVKYAYYADCFPEGTTQNTIFSIARDVAADILDILQATN